jgi:tetratricopeptide (TPR) repeat protein
VSSDAGASVADEWMQIARKDWRRAERNLKDRDPEAAGFFLQQSLEKYLKAFLLKHNWKLRKIHELDALLDEASKFQHDQVPIHWQIKDKPDGYAVNPEFGKHLQQDRSETVRISRVYKDLSSPESKFGIEWWYDTGPSTKSEVVVTLYSSPDAPRAYRDTLSSIKLAGRPDLIELPLDVKQNVSPSGQAYFKTQVLRAAGFYKEAIPQIEFARGVNPDLDKSSDFTRVAGMTYLRINQPAEAIKYFERLSELDPTSSIYLAATLVGLGKASAAHAVTNKLRCRYQWLRTPLTRYQKRSLQLHSPNWVTIFLGQFRRRREPADYLPRIFTLSFRSKLNRCWSTVK